jgi:hypothetical protein
VERVCSSVCLPIISENNSGLYEWLSGEFVELTDFIKIVAIHKFVDLRSVKYASH